MEIAKSGDTVQVHYTGTLDDGSEFDSSSGREPLEFILGQGQVIQGFDTAITGMQVGENKTVRIPAEEAYGTHREDLVLELDRSQFPDDITLELGLELMLRQSDGQPVPVKVTAIQDQSVQLDANHPLAGQALTFALELVAIH